MRKTFETPGPVRVVVDNAVGMVVIDTGGTGHTEVDLEPDAMGAEELIERATVECQPSGDGHVVRVKIPHRHGMKFVRRNGVTVRITMPAEGDAEVSTASADVELNGTIGEAKVTTASGHITADDASGNVRVETASGRISLGAVRGNVRLHTVSGDVRVDRVSGHAELTSSSGDIEIGSAGAGADVRSTSGEVRMGDVAGDASVVAVSGSVRVLSYAAGCLRVRAISGNIELGVARGTRLVVDAETMSGTVQSDIPLGDEPTGVGESGAGGPEVDITARSVSGNVLVHRAAEAAVR